MSDLNFAEKQNFLRRGWMVSGDLPLSRTDNISIISRSELASLAHSLYACIKHVHHINDCTVVNGINNNYFAETFQIGYSATKRGGLKHERERAHPDRSCDSLNQLYVYTVRGSVIVESGYYAHALTRITAKVHTPHSELCQITGVGPARIVT